jgi:hypothetical protein
MLERAAGSVTPSETDPATRMVSLGRRSVRRRRAWAACSIAVVVAAAVAVPFALAAPDGSDSAGPGGTVSFGGLTISVPKGWRATRTEMFNSCTAERRTIYLATRWDLGYGARPSSGPDAGTTRTCNSEGQAWMAAVTDGFGPAVSPGLLEVKNGQLLEVEQLDEDRFPSMWIYRPYNGDIRATTVFISGDDGAREQQLKRITWPAGPTAPPGGGLALPDTIKDALTDAPPSNGMVIAQDAKTLTQIRAKLAELRDPVPAGEECALRKPGSVGISFGEITVVLGDATCPQAISTGGGRVRAPAGLGQELLDLIVASDRARSTGASKD